jgi:hypothetical protein
MSPEQMRRQRLMELSGRSREDEEIMRPNRRAMLSGISDQGEDLKSAAQERERFAAEMEQQKIEKAEQDEELKEHREKMDKGFSLSPEQGGKIGKLIAGMATSPYSQMDGSRMPKFEDRSVDVMSARRKALMNLLG